MLSLLIAAEGNPVKMIEITTEGQKLRWSVGGEVEGAVAGIGDRGIG